MKKTLLITSLIIAIVIVLAILSFILMQNPAALNTKTTPETTPTTTTPNTPIEAPLSGQAYNINIKGFAFSPSTLNIKKGDKVIWTNQDTALHTVTSDSGTELSSDTLSHGETYLHTFNAAGTYKYHCNLHSNMKANIIVK